MKLVVEVNLELAGDEGNVGLWQPEHAAHMLRVAADILRRTETTDLRVLDGNPPEYMIEEMHASAADKKTGPMIIRMQVLDVPFDQTSLLTPENTVTQEHINVQDV